MDSYPYGYCGMPCALCSRYRTAGASRCPGCSCNGYYTDACKVHHCCRDGGFGHCGKCGRFPCSKLGRMGDFSDLYTNHVKQRTCAAIAADGFDRWYADYAERANLLTTALERYNNGRMKRWLCELFIVQDLAALRRIMRRATEIAGDPKERGAAFRRLAEEETAAQGEARL